MRRITITIWSNAGDKLIPIFYRVIINTSNAVNYPAIGTDGGAISPNTPAEIVKAGGAVGTDAQSQVKAQANLRWFRILEELNRFTQPNLLNIDVTGEINVADVPTALGFTIFYERDEFNIVEDLDNPGTFLTGIPAITQLVANAIATSFNRNMDLRLPDVGSKNQASFSLVSFTSVQTRLQTEGDITVETAATAGSGIEETAQGV